MRFEQHSSWTPAGHYRETRQKYYEECAATVFQLSYELKAKGYITEREFERLNPPEGDPNSGEGMEGMCRSV